MGARKRGKMGTVGVMKYKSMTFKQKIMSATSVIAILIGSVSLFGYQYSFHQYSDLLYKQTAGNLSSFSKELSNNLNSITEISLNISTSPAIQNHLMTIDRSSDLIEKHRASNQIVQTLYNYLTPDILSVSIIFEAGNRISCGLDSTPESKEVTARIKEVCGPGQGAETWIMTGRADGSVLCVREIRKTKDPYFMKSLGYLAVRVNLKKILREMSAQTFPDYSGAIVIRDEKGAPVYPVDHSFPLENISFKQTGDAYHIEKSGGKSYFLIHTVLTELPPAWEILYGIPYDDVFRPVTIIRSATITLIIIAIALSLLFTKILVQNINYQFQLMITKMNRLKAGNFELLPSKKQPGGDELEILNQYFDDMTLEFKRMIEDNYVKQLLITQTQLKTLKQQINPHFLYNTLESINWFAKREKEEHIPVIVEALATLLRNSLSDGEDVISLKEELVILDSYLKIQKIRYQDMLEIWYDIDHRLLSTKIPKMSLQPLVENAITYSMEESIDGCRIIIGARKENGNALITVENNGSQIDPDILEKLKAKKIRANGYGIGLINIDSRIKLLFGEKYGLSFINGEDQVIARLTLPLEGS